MSFTEKEIEAAAEGVHGHQILAFDGMQVVCECDETWQDAAEYPAHLSRAAIAAVTEARTVTDVAGLDALGYRSIITSERRPMPYVKGLSGKWCQIGTTVTLSSRWLADALEDGDSYAVLHYGEGAGK